MQKKKSLRSKGCEECLCNKCKKQKNCYNCTVCIFLTRKLTDSDNVTYSCKRFKER